MTWLMDRLSQHMPPLEQFQREYMGEFITRDTWEYPEYPQEIGTMNLSQTILALSQLKTEQYPQGITTAIDLGAHTACDINSNCPVAVELRKYIHDAGVTLEQLLVGFAESQSVPPPIDYDLPEFDGKVAVTIAGTRVELDLTALIEDRLGGAWRAKITELESMGYSIRRLGESLYRGYLDRVESLSRTKTLPQLQYSEQELVKAGCMITSNGENYLFIFPQTYMPQWIIDGGTRYKIVEGDILAITRTAYLRFTITPAKKILNVSLLGERGAGLEHYHGREYGDCWGMVKIPESWDGRLETLSNIRRQLEGALATINYNSIMVRTPHGMPEVGKLLDRSTELGKEGVMSKAPIPDTGGRWEGGDTPATGWGRPRAITTPPAPATRPPGMEDTQWEYFRRWGWVDRAEPRRGEEAICVLCGEPWDHHNNWVCPRDRR